MVRATRIWALGIFLSFSTIASADSDFSAGGADGSPPIPNKKGVLSAVAVNNKTCTAYFALMGEGGISYEAPVCDCPPELLKPPNCLPQDAAQGTVCRFTSFFLPDPKTGAIPAGNISCSP